MIKKFNKYNEALKPILYKRVHGSNKENSDMAIILNFALIKIEDDIKEKISQEKKIFTNKDKNNVGYGNEKDVLHRMIKIALKAGRMYEKLANVRDPRVTYFEYLLDLLKKDKTEDLYYF